MLFRSGPAFGDNTLDPSGRLRTFTNSTVATTLSSSTLDVPSTAFTTPDLGPSNSPGAPGENNDAAPTQSATALTPVVALPTSEPESQMGLAKVADPDVDAFMSYAAIVPEYCRLEGMLVKGLV